MSAKKQTFEQQIARLEEIVAALEKGDAQLADSLALFEEGTKLAASVITLSENVCPRFLPRELGLDIEVEDLDK